ncbi:LysR family transcriptional regulator [Acuticoccus sp. MNP-M23]|uniref:LysR family transcriptional regulator n=1 Tax=Acuticoccus sp. MNP-M23 TaxID=3072793 RepID=UPI002814A06A|nr:LysR family transcriptional regulator [Acuticoccus sp. MNP-M23]WMS42661.1 LysR family transcriptional regulator [Acuticoccus sp. MNP-M23]
MTDHAMTPRKRAAATTPQRSGGARTALASALHAMTWDDLRVALAVGRAGSIARASEALSVDPATVSRRINALEQALGSILFTRNKAGMVPTDAGGAMLSRAAEIEHRTFLLEEEIAALGTASGAVRVAGHVWAIAQIAAVGAPLLKAAHPGISLRLIAARPPIDLPTGLPTVSLWFETPPRENEFCITLGDAPYAVYARSDICAESAPMLCHRNEDGPARAPDRWESGQDCDAASPLSATDSMILREAVRAGLGKGLLPMCLAAGDPTLRRVGSGGPELVRSLQLHVHPDIVQLTRVRNLIDTFRMHFNAIFGTNISDIRKIDSGNSNTSYRIGSAKKEQNSHAFRIAN